MLTFIGLGVIVLAWLYQLVSLASGNQNLRFAFAGLYALGVVALVVDGFMSGMQTIAYFNLASLVAALLVGVFILKKKV